MKNKNIKSTFIIAIIGTILSSILVSATLAQAGDLKTKQQIKARTIMLESPTAKSKKPILKYKSIKSSYKQEVDAFKNTKKQFLDARGKFKSFKNKENKAVLEDSARDYLKKTILVLIKKTESINDWVSNDKSIEDQEKNNIITELDSDISWLNSMVDNIDEATQEQVKVKAKEVKDYWKEHRVKMKKITGQIMASRISFLIKKSELISTKISSRIEKLKQAGKDVSAIEAIPNVLNEKINLAKVKATSAKSTFSSISNLSEANNLFLKGRGFVSQAQTYIKEGRNSIKQMISAHRQANK
ncbi:hypothetical protein ISS06_00550 [Patescibacteria group bacterium]|nr:hypothetical protein [Patescibacteria group bacterium]